MSIWTDISDFEKEFIDLLDNLLSKRTHKQTDVSAECEDSIQFEDKYGNFIINDSTVNIYQY